MLIVLEFTQQIDPSESNCPTGSLVRDSSLAKNGNERIPVRLRLIIVGLP